MIERTLILLKPDAVQRSFVGEVITRFERAGLKIVGMKLHWADEKLAKLHYTDDLAKRRGEMVRNKNVNFIKEGPVVAICLEGVSSIEVVRKMAGDTEPRKAMPGTIRGDYAHMTYEFADSSEKRSLRNIIHASANKEDAEHEIKIWFKPEELHTYKTVHDVHIF